MRLQIKVKIDGEIKHRADLIGTPKLIGEHLKKIRNLFKEYSYTTYLLDDKGFPAGRILKK